MKMKRQTVQQWANSYARRQGRGTATDLTVALGGDRVKVVESWHPGWRKYTTGEYVSNAYRNNFGWKNTYYQHAVFELEIPFSFIAHCTDALDYLGPALKDEHGLDLW